MRDDAATRARSGRFGAAVGLGCARAGEERRRVRERALERAARAGCVAADAGGARTAAWSVRRGGGGSGDRTGGGGVERTHAGARGGRGRNGGARGAGAAERARARLARQRLGRCEVV